MGLCISQNPWTPKSRETGDEAMNDPSNSRTNLSISWNGQDNQEKKDSDFRLLYLSGRSCLIENLTATLFDFYQAEGDGELLSALIILAELNLDLVLAINSGDRPSVLARLGTLLYTEHEMTYNLSALEQSIQYLETAHDLVQLHHPTRMGIDLALAEALHGRCKASSNIQDVHTALQILESLRSGLVTASDTVAWAVVYSSIVTNTYARQYVKFPQENIEALLSKLEDVSPTSLTSLRMAELYHARSSLSLFLAHRGRDQNEITGGPDGASLALQLYPLNHWRRYIVIAEAQVWADHLYNTNAQRLDAERSVFLCEQMIDCAGTSVYRQSEALYRWAGAAFEIAVLDNNLDSMERAIAALKEVAAICPPKNLLQRRLISYTSGLLGMYFEHSGRMDALDEVISLRDTHYALIIEGAFTAANVAESMLLRARTVDRRAADLLLQSAVAMLEERKRHVGFATEPWERTAVDLQLITASHMQLQAGKTPTLDGDAIVILARDTLARGTPGDPHRPGVVMALCQALLSQAHRGRFLSLIDEVNVLLQEELASQSVILWVYRAGLMAMTAYSTVLRSELTGDVSLLEEAWTIYEDTITNTHSSSHGLFMITLQWAAVATEHGCLEVALQAYAHAQSLLPRVIFLGQDVVGRLEALRQVNGLASSSSTLAFSLRNIPSGVQFLEQTRGILWNQALQLRAPDDNLPTHLRERLATVNEELQKNGKQNWTAQRHKAQELEQVLREIRSTPGFENFLLPPSVQDLSSMFRERNGYAVMVIPSDSFCDVICLGAFPDGYRHIRIHAINRELLHQMGKSLAFSCASSRASREARKVARMAPESPISMSDNAISKILADLWVTLVKPIVDILDFQTGSRKRKRIWWCPIGAFTSLPLHAAGIYEGPNQDNVGNYTTSSYTPTLSALRHILTQESTTSPVSETKILLISQSDHGSLASLPNTTLEVEQVQAIVPASSLLDLGKEGCIPVDTVLQALPDVAVLHLACHGNQDQVDPLNSGFDLFDGRLRLGQLMRVSTKNAQLAYLSACESAAVDETRPDEVINLAATMLFVGFKSVIATMWAMDDVDGPFVAELVYRRIFRYGYLDLASVPDALHDAVCELRSRGVHPSRWATYIHIGA